MKLAQQQLVRASDRGGWVLRRGARRWAGASRGKGRGVGKGRQRAPHPPSRCACAGQSCRSCPAPRRWGRWGRRCRRAPGPPWLRGCLQRLGGIGRGGGGLGSAPRRSGGSASRALRGRAARHNGRRWAGQVGPSRPASHAPSSDADSPLLALALAWKGCGSLLGLMGPAAVAGLSCPPADRPADRPADIPADSSGGWPEERPSRGPAVRGPCGWWGGSAWWCGGGWLWWWGGGPCGWGCGWCCGAGAGWDGCCRASSRVLSPKKQSAMLRPAGARGPGVGRVGWGWAGKAAAGGAPASAASQRPRHCPSRRVGAAAGWVCARGGGEVAGRGGGRGSTGQVSQGGSAHTCVAGLLGVCRRAEGPKVVPLAAVPQAGAKARAVPGFVGDACGREEGGMREGGGGQGGFSGAGRSAVGRRGRGRPLAWAWAGGGGGHYACCSCWRQHGAAPAGPSAEPGGRRDMLPYAWRRSRKAAAHKARARRAACSSCGGATSAGSCCAHLSCCCLRG
jgi:hypothetical protein